jgi:hypothetical protein
VRLQTPRAGSQPECPARDVRRNERPAVRSTTKAPTATPAAERQCEVYEAALFCIFGYMLMKLDLPAAPLLLGLLLGPAIEEDFRRATVLSRGDSTVFLTSPLSGGLLAAFRFPRWARGPVFEFSELQMGD